MKKRHDVPQIGQLDAKIIYGDYTTLSQMLKCKYDAARKRFRRGNPEAIAAMRTIIETRENTIENFQKD